MKLPVLFLCHGGPPHLRMYESSLHKFWIQLGIRLNNNFIKPGHIKSILIISAHWEEYPSVKVNSAAEPGLIYDFYGFEEELYKEKYDCKGDHYLATRVQHLLETSSINCDLDGSHGLDHGVWIPLKVMLPVASIPIVQLSLHGSLDPNLHLKMGRALAPLRDEGVLIIGSGAPVHNLREMFSPKASWASNFDAMLTNILTAYNGSSREEKMLQLIHAADTLRAHPRIEHLIPAYITVGAGGSDCGKKLFEDFDPPNLALSTCLYNTHWHASRKSVREEDIKLMNGLTFEMRGFLSRMSPVDMTKDAPVMFTTSKYSLHFFESPTFYKFILLTTQTSVGLGDLLHRFYTQIFVEHVVKNPLYEPDKAIDKSNELFAASTDRFFKEAASSILPVPSLQK